MSKHYKPKNSQKRNIAKSAVDLISTIITSICNVIISLFGFIGSFVE